MKTVIWTNIDCRGIGQISELISYFIAISRLEEIFCYELQTILLEAEA